MVRVVLAIMATSVLAVTACAPRSTGHLEAPAPGAPPVGEAARGIHEVMQAKLVHAQAVVEGVVWGDFQIVETNAVQLEALSNEAGWLVHDTVTYTVFSEQFRKIAGSMAVRARNRNLDAVTADYMELIRTCVACHTYLRRERLIGDFPEEFSMLSPLGPPRAAIP